MSLFSAEDDAIEALLAMRRVSLDIQVDIRRARIERLRTLLVWWSTALLVPALTIVNIFTWGRIDLARINLAFIPIGIALLITSLALRESTSRSNWDKTYIA